VYKILEIIDDSSTLSPTPKDPVSRGLIGSLDTPTQILLNILRY